MKKTAMKPVDRFQSIHRIVKDIKAVSRDILMEFEIDLSVDPTKAPGKVLRAPTLLYGKDRRITPKDGKWNMNGLQLYHPVPLKDWVVFSFSRRQDDLNLFLQLFQTSASAMGMDTHAPLTVRQYRGLDSVEEMFLHAKSIFDTKSKTNGPKLVLVFTPRNEQLYQQVKFLGEIDGKRKYGYCTQVIDELNVSRKIGRDNDINQYIANVLLKVNVKLGGINQIVDPAETPVYLRKEKGVMVIGADVTHAAYETGECSSSIPYSIAALCGSYEPNYIKYYTESRVQAKSDDDETGFGQQSQEIITCIDQMFMGAVKNYYLHNRKSLPQHIIYYRDGVSEGQFHTVLDEEITHIKGTFDKISGIVHLPFNPKITLVIVGKRHQSRILPEFICDGIGRSGNIPAGTLVDTCITNPDDFDYFLNSHEGIQGTSRPAHYTLLLDEHGFTADEIYLLTYFLCHTYVKSTRSISIPSPVKYADLTAFRSRIHLKASNFAHLELPSSSSSEDQHNRQTAIHERIQQMNCAIRVVPALRDRFYFC